MKRSPNALFRRRSPIRELIDSNTVFFGITNRNFHDLGMFKSALGWGTTGIPKPGLYRNRDSTFASSSFARGPRWARPQDTCGIGSSSTACRRPSSRYLSAAVRLSLSATGRSHEPRRIMEMYYCWRSTRALHHWRFSGSQPQPTPL